MFATEMIAFLFYRLQIVREQKWRNYLTEKLVKFTKRDRLKIWGLCGELGDEVFPTLRIIGPSYGGVWLSIGGFWDL